MDELDEQQGEQNNDNNTSCNSTNSNNDNDKGVNADDTATELCEDDYYSDDDDCSSSSYENNNNDEHSQYSYQDNDECGRPLPMPQLKYARIMGALPCGNHAKSSIYLSSSPTTTLSLKITSSAMGRIVWHPSLFFFFGCSSE